MSRYTKIASKYILAKYHQNTSQGVLYERDWTTIGNVHRLEPGKRVYYGNSNFIFTESTFPVYKKKRKNGKWVGEYTYEDVRNAEDLVNIIKVNTDSENLSDYAYWGSMVELFRGSVEHIIRTFPGRLRSTKKKLPIHHHWPYLNNGVEYWDEAPGYILGNPFGLDMHTETTDIDTDDLLRYVALTWKKYVLENYDGEETETTELTSYIIDKSTYEQFDCEARYFRLCTIVIFSGATGLLVDTYLTDGKIVYCYRPNDDPETYKFLITYYSGLIETANTPPAEYTPTHYTVTLTEEDLTIPSEFAICPNEEVVEEYFRSLEGFEWKLLNRRTKPYYKNVFLLPVQLESGNWKLVRRTYTWPSEGIWIDIESTDFDTFISSMVDMCEVYDNLWCDAIWRCMVHESVKNFDWSYRREYDDNDAADNIEGGNRMKDVMRLYGIFYDNAKRYVDGIGLYNSVTYDGYNNCPNAQISDRNMLQGWDITSTQHQFYWYTDVSGRVENPEDYQGFPVLPVNIDDESPELISVTCPGQTGTYYYTKDTIPVSEISLDTEFFNPDDPEVSIVEKQENPWVNENIYGKYYAEIGFDLVTPGYDFEVGNRTLNEYPYQLFEGVDSPEFIKVVTNNGTKYYKLLNAPAEIAANNERYVNGNWFDCVNEKVITTATTDILFNRMLNLSSNRILKTKGSKEAIDMVFSLFGFGRYVPEGDSYLENPYGDYIITEQYERFTTKEYGETFYFYEVISAEEAEGHSPATKYSIPKNPNPDTGSEDYIVVITQTSSGSQYETYYKLNGQYLVSDVIRLLYAHRITERIYDDYYSGVPIKDEYMGETHLVVPFYDRSRVYEGNLYFQEKGGWMCTGDNPWDNSETIPYLHILQRISDLLSLNTNGVNNGDIYFVADVSDYYEYTNDIPYYLSNYFKLRDKYNSSRFSSWVNIPIDGPIRNDVDGVEKDDYLHAKHLDEIIPTILFNNPHCGYDRYDKGEEYKAYMETPYKYSAENYLYDDDYYQNMALQFSFAYENVELENEDKVFVNANTVTYGQGNRTNQDMPAAMDVVAIDMDDNIMPVNDKFLKITLVDNGEPIDATDPHYRKHLEYMRNVVMKYVVQVIPSTTILVLDNFITPEAISNDTVEIRVNIEGEGVVYGAGEYLKTSMVTLSAIPAEGYHFVGWRGVNRTDSPMPPTPQTEPIGSTDNVINVMACANKIYTAIFSEDCAIEYGCTISTCPVIADN